LRQQSVALGEQEVRPLDVAFRAAPVHGDEVCRRSEK
jgi:hypothetical protein